MDSQLPTDANKLLQSIIWNDYYIHYQTYENMIIIEFNPDGNDEYESYRKAYGVFPMIYMYIHLIMFKTLEIVTYKMQLNSPRNIFNNLKYYTGFVCIECHGSKCRQNNKKLFCESCYDPDYLQYSDLVLMKNKNSSIENDMLLIYNYEDFTQNFDNLLYLFTRDIFNDTTNLPTAKLISINEKKKLELIKTMYSGVQHNYYSLDILNFNIGPNPNELPIPKTLLSIN